MASDIMEKKAERLIQKSIDDINNALRDVDALDTMFKHSQYAILSQAKANLDNAKSRMREMTNQIQYLRIQNIIGYGIWYSDGISSYPAAGKFKIRIYYKTKEEAKRIATQLAQANRNLAFGVYPYDENYNIAGKPVAVERRI